MGDLFHRAIRSILARFMATALALSGVCSGLGAQESKLANFESKAPYAILIDSRSGKVYYENHADDMMAPASMSKVMTMIMVFEGLKTGRLHLTDEFAISENAWRQGRCGIRRVDHVCGAELEG